MYNICKELLIMDENLAKIRHERSKKDFPMLTLEDDEYVEYAFKRASVCLMLIMAGTGIGVIIILLGFLLVLLGQSMIDEMGKKFLFIMLFALFASVIVIRIVALKTYRGNRLFITNQRVIQLLMTSLVSSSVNAIDLTGVEDVSFHQDGIMPRIFHYGTLRLATVGDETTYTFKYSDITPEDMKAISKMITDAKKRHRRNDKENA
jgi:hypothetical protein